MRVDHDQVRLERVAAGRGADPGQAPHPPLFGAQFAKANRTLHLPPARQQQNGPALCVRAQPLCAAGVGLGRQVPKQTAGGGRFLRRSLFDPSRSHQQSAAARRRPDAFVRAIRGVRGRLQRQPPQFALANAGRPLEHARHHTRFRRQSGIVPCRISPACSTMSAPTGGCERRSALRTTHRVTSPGRIITPMRSRPACIVLMRAISSVSAMRAPSRQWGPPSENVLVQNRTRQFHIAIASI